MQSCVSEMQSPCINDISVGDDALLRLPIADRTRTVFNALNNGYWFACVKILMQHIYFSIKGSETIVFSNQKRWLLSDAKLPQPLKLQKCQYLFPVSFHLAVAFTDTDFQNKNLY